MKLTPDMLIALQDKVLNVFIACSLVNGKIVVAPSGNRGYNIVWTKTDFEVSFDSLNKLIKHFQPEHLHVYNYQIILRYVPASSLVALLTWE